MRLNRIFAQSIVLALVTSTTASAQVTLRNTARELTDGLSDVLHIWVSPFRAEGRDWISALGVAAGAAALLPVDDQVDSWIVRHSNAAIVHAVSPWDENHPNLGDLSTGQRLLPISVALLVPGMISDNRKLREAGWGCLSAWQASSTIREAVYAGISRERPSIAEGDQYAITTPGGEWEYHSFFAGHATNAWACTSFWNSRFHLGALEPILYAGATGITLSRMKDRRHWASDTWVGIAAGYAMGRSVAARYARREAKRNAKPEAEPIRASFLEGLSVAPIRGGLALGWSGIF